MASNSSITTSWDTQADFWNNEAENEFQDRLSGVSTVATISDSVTEYARNVGSERCERAWICSPYDSWEPNPYYSGPEMPHPEDEVAAEDIPAWRKSQEARRKRTTEMIENAKWNDENSLSSDGVPF